MPMRAGITAQVPVAREPFRRSLLFFATLAASVLALASCVPHPVTPLFPNQRPSVVLTAAPAASDSTSPYFYAYRMDWSGNDPDGRVDHYDYCVDPGATDSTWVRTTKNEQVVFFRASRPDPLRPGEQPTASDPHVFVIRAVDNHGALSPPVFRAFYAFTIAPTIEILNPHPNRLLPAVVPPSVRIEWTGSDPDGQFTQKPVRYKFRLYKLPEVSGFLGNLDSLRLREAANHFAGWDSTSADTQFAQFTNLTPGGLPGSDPLTGAYVFIVIAFDEAGAYSPVFSLDSNVLQISCGVAASNGPIIHMWNQYIDFTYPAGGYTADPQRWIPIEIPSHRELEVNWDAIPPAGSRIQYFRWMLDGNINDESPRTNEDTDYHHWSRKDPTMPGRTVLYPGQGFEPGHYLFYLECADNNGLKSLGVLAITVVTPSFDRELLVIDDTRLEADKFARANPGPGDCPLGYTKPWPARAELDTFLFARGGFPWRCVPNPAAGKTSIPGLLAGYSFDTLGTNLHLENPANGVLLSRIGAYRNIVWLVDGEANSFSLPSVYPPGALFTMSAPGHASTLEAYTQLGGRVWLVGGGAAYSSLISFKKSKDQGQTTVFTAREGHLGPGRILYDGAHWQSAVGVTRAVVRTLRNERSVRVLHGGIPEDSTIVVTQPWEHANPWTGTILRSPDYTHLPAEMRLKDPATDLLPPTRQPGQSNAFYRSSLPCEYILQPNFIVEDTDPDPDVDHEESVLDTLLQSQGVVLLTNPDDAGNRRAPTMTYYHGSQANQFVFTGLSVWNYNRDDCLRLVDFVLQDLWGLSRAPVDRGGAAAATRSRAMTPPRIVTAAPRATMARRLHE